MTVLLTERLRLEPFDERHLDGLNEMNSLPEVMRYISGEPQTREQTMEGIARVQRCWEAWGTSWWAFVDLSSSRVLGAGCIQYLRREATGPSDLDSWRSNPLEIGWRLHPDYWRRGLASEAAKRMATFAFEVLGALELLAVRNPENVQSARVMDRLGMQFRGIESWYGTDLATHFISRDKWLQQGREFGEA